MGLPSAVCGVLCVYISLDNSRMVFIKTDSGCQMLRSQARFQPKQSMQFMRNELWCQNESVVFIFLNCPMRSYGKKGKSNIIQYVNLSVCMYFTPWFFQSKQLPDTIFLIEFPYGVASLNSHKICMISLLLCQM